MAQTVDEIAEILNEMRTQNENNAVNLAKVLTDINTRLELMTDDNGLSDILRVYISELKKSIEDRHGTTLSKFDELEQNLKNVVTENDFKNFKSDLADFVQKIIDNSSALNSELSYNREKLENILTNVNSLNYRDDFQDIIEKIQDVFEYSLKLTEGLSGIDDKISALGKIYSDNSKNNCENIISGINDIKTSFENNSKTNYDNIISEINNLKFEIKSSNNSEFIEQINLSLSDILSNIQFLRDVSSQKYSQLLDCLSEALRSILIENNEVLNSNSELNFGQLKVLAEQNIQKIENLEKTLSEQENLLAIEDRFAKLFAELELIKVEYKDYLEQSNEQYSNQFRTISDNVENLKSRIDETVDCIKNYVFELETIAKDNGETGSKISQKLLDLEASLLQVFQDYEQKMNLLQTSLTEFVHIVEGSNADIEGKISSSLDKINGELEEKFSSLEESFKNTNDTISDILKEKSEEMLKTFEPIYTNLEELARFDFDKILLDIKSQIEMSFMNFTLDINSGIESHSESFARLENAYKEAYNKISDIEDCVKDNIRNDIELLGTSFETSLRNLKNDLDKNYDAKSAEIIENIRKNLSAGFDLIKNNQENIEKKTDDISENIAKASENIVKTLKEDNSLLQLSIADLEVKLDAHNLDTEVKDNVEIINAKIDTLVEDSTTESIIDEIDDVKNIIFEQNKFFNASFDQRTEAIDKYLKDVISKLENVNTGLNAKIDTLVEDITTESIIDEIDDIKNIIFEQRKFFEASSDEKVAAIDKYLRDVLLKLVDVDKNAEDIKETILNALISVVDQISFVEESEDIKDFVEEKTAEINQNIQNVQSQLKQLATNDDEFDYRYTLQDVESDIAKLRLAINNVSGADFSDLSEEIQRIVNSVEKLENSLTQDEISDLKNDIEKLSEDVLSISSRTNKLLLNSDESYKALNEGLDNFSKIIYKLEDRINYLDDAKVTERLERKIDNIQSLTSTSANADKVFHQAMMYLGEWVDATTEDISSISDQTAQIDLIQKDINEMKTILPKELADRIEHKLESQAERIDILENKLEKIMSIVEEKNDMLLNRKIDKIEKMLSVLTNNVEKLTSYVDEE